MAIHAKGSVIVLHPDEALGEAHICQHICHSSNRGIEDTSKSCYSRCRTFLGLTRQALSNFSLLEKNGKKLSHNLLSQGLKNISELKCNLADSAIALIII